MARVFGWPERNALNTVVRTTIPVPDPTEAECDPTEAECDRYIRSQAFRK